MSSDVQINPQVDPDHSTAMLEPLRKWDVPSAEEVESIKKTILQLEAKLADDILLDYPAEAIIKELALNKAYIAPIRKLPFEILSEIFILCSLSSGRSTPVRISAVCHRWRQTILATPQAWSRINPYTKGRQSPATLLAYVITFLERSHQCLLHLDWSDHPYSCFRTVRRGPQSGSPWENHCRCDIVEKIAEHSDRIQCLQADNHRSHVLINMDLPNVERLTSNYWTSTLLHKLAKFPKLSCLHVGEYIRSEMNLELPLAPHTQLRHISISTDPSGVWSQFINLNGKTLKTLKLATDFSYPRDSQQSRVLECPALERIVVIDRSSVLSAQLRPDMMFVVKMMAPDLKFYQYSSSKQIVRLAHDTDFNKVEQLRTDYDTPLSHYRHLHILQVFYRPALILDILDQLEGDYDLCPELSIIEVRDGLSNTSSWTENHGETIHDRIAARNMKANSHIKLLIKPDLYRWKYSLREDDEIWGHDLPCLTE